MSLRFARLRAKLGIALPILLSIGCATPARDVHFSLSEYEKPVLLSAVDRIGAKGAHDPLRDRLIERAETSCTYTSDLVVVPPEAVQIEEKDPESAPTHELRSEVAADPGSDVFVDKLHVEQSAFFAVLVLHETNEVEMDCSVFDTSGRNAPNE